MSKLTKVINIYGAPGSGKSTLAAELYAVLKKEGKSVELVRECIKRWAYQEKRPTVFDQMYIMTEQMREESSLYGKVDYIITDSPLFLGEFYLDYYHDSDDMPEFSRNICELAQYKGLKDERSINFYIPLDEKIYTNEGRYSNLNESKKIDELLFTQLSLQTELHVLDSNLEDRYFNARKIIEHYS